MTSPINFYLAQKNFIVGDIAENFLKIKKSFQNSPNNSLVIFPELAITGYPPEDLLLSKHFLNNTLDYQKKIISLTKNNNKAILFGGIFVAEDKLYNVAIFAENGRIKNIIKKNNLPNYGVFDEKRYFSQGENFTSITFQEKKFLILICEDIWTKNLSNHLTSWHNLDGIIIINASPFDIKKQQKRLEITKNIAKKINSLLIYLNLIGGQDSLVFDGNSFIINKKGEIVQKLASCQEEELFVSLDEIDKSKEKNTKNDKFAEIYNVLILGIRDYFAKNKKKSVLIGLSGGVDSAICAILCSDALGVENVNLVMMPSKHTSDESCIDADLLIKNLKCKNISSLSIKKIFLEYSNILKLSFANKKADLTEENLQARIRGTLLMALSNKLGHLVIATSNKSETAVGYTTLYGDMCGAYSPIKDIYKTDLYQLCIWRNNNIPKIAKLKAKDILPQNIINKEPTAELRENQKDSDSLPSYEILDKILFNLIEQRKSIKEIIKLGFTEDDIKKISKLVKLSEYKRKQSALGPKISTLSFDKERRIAISS